MDLSKIAAFDHQFPVWFGIDTHSEIIPSLAMTTRSKIHRLFHVVEIYVFTSVQTGWEMNTVQELDSLNETHVTSIELAYTNTRIGISTIYDGSGSRYWMGLTGKEISGKILGSQVFENHTKLNSHLAIMKCNPMNTRFFFCTSHCTSTSCQTQREQFCEKQYC